MPTTYNIVMPVTSATRTLTCGATARMAEIAKSFDGNKARLVLKDPLADPLYPVVVEVTCQQAGKETRNSIAIRTEVQIIDTDGNIIGVEPLSVVVAVNAPRLGIDSDDVLDLVAYGVGTLFTGNDPNNVSAPLAGLLAGVPTSIEE